MLSHVSRQNYPNESLAEGLKIVPSEVFQEVVLSLVENCERLSRMEALLDTLITVADGSV